jgi:hypothetical protein
VCSLITPSVFALTRRAAASETCHFAFRHKKCGPIELIWKLGFDVVGWHEECGGVLACLALGDFVAYSSADAMQDKVT